MLELALREYESVILALDDAQARKLADSGLVSVGPAPGAGNWELTARQYVGTAVIDDVTLLIRPKIKPENLFLLLEVGLPEQAWRREAFEYASGAQLLPSIIAFFARTVETTLARGLLRGYREERESLLALRGRIDFVAQFNRAGIALPVACRYEEFTANIRENRYLKAALRRALGVPLVHAEERQRIMRQLAAFEEVHDSPVGVDEIDHVVVTRLNQHYQPALRLAHLLLANLTLVDQQGSTSASSFMVDMNLLFERFITERLRRALRGRVEVADQTSVPLAHQRSVMMRPDLEFRCNGATAFVGDIKYKLTSDARARNADYYQLLAYTTALEVPEGVLIYCLTDGGTPEKSVTVRHSGKVLHTRAIAMNGSSIAISEQIEQLATWINQRALAHSGSSRKTN